MRRDLVPSTTPAPVRQPRRQAHGHTPWCGTRCRAGRALLGEHRSDPLTAVAGPIGGTAVVGTRVAQADGRQHLELRINIPLPATTDDHRATVADRAMRAITEAVAAAVTGPPTPALTTAHHSRSPVATGASRPRTQRQVRPW